MKLSNCELKMRRFLKLSSQAARDFYGIDKNQVMATTPLNIISLG